MFEDVFCEKSVFVTGHTGFKGSWLCHWLLRLGAKVHGYALAPQPHEVLYDQLQLGQRVQSDTRGDIRDLAELIETVSAVEPDFVFHLAAQPLVRLSFEIPVETFGTNVMGTANLLESFRSYRKPCNVVIVTTDKCYANREWVHSYREEDAMGGHDPYSGSKGCAELVVSSYRDSFFGSNASVSVASGRAGNVIGGGDWAKDRIMPDIFRAVFSDQPIPIRNRTATRPWQHVLEPLSGYLSLAASMPGQTRQFCDAFNFGPHLDSNRTVLDLVKQTLLNTGGDWIDKSDPDAVHEASRLNLAIDKAFHMLGWKPTWDFETTIAKTSEWYVSVNRGADPVQQTDEQIESFEHAVQEGQLSATICN